MGNLFAFVCGITVGIYIDQTHKVPSVEKWLRYGIKKIRDWEERTRKD